MYSECSSARFLRTPGHVSMTGKDSTTPHERDVIVRSPQDNGPVLIGGIFVLPTMGNSGSQDIPKIRKSISTSVSRNAQKFDTSVDRNLADDGDSMAIFRKVLGHKISDSLSANIYSCCQLDFTSKAVGTKEPYFVHLDILAVNALNEFGAFGAPDTRVRIQMYGSYWSALGHVFEEVTAAGMNRAGSEKNYSYKTDSEIRRKNQDFGLQNTLMSQLPLVSTHIGTNKTNGTTSQIHSTAVGEKTPHPTP